jgi:hypothetical protein
VKDDIEDFFRPKGDHPYDRWHVGLTSHVEKSFADHGMEIGDPHFHVKANAPSQARIIVRFLLYRGMTGDLEHYDSQAEFVYVYLNSSKTSP